MPKPGGLKLEGENWIDFQEVYKFMKECITIHEFKEPTEKSEDIATWKYAQINQRYAKRLLNIEKSQYLGYYKNEHKISKESFCFFCSKVENLIDRRKTHKDYRKTKAKFKSWETRITPLFENRNKDEIRKRSLLDNESTSYFSFTHWTIISGYEDFANKVDYNVFKLSIFAPIEESGSILDAILYNSQSNFLAKGTIELWGRYVTSFEEEEEEEEESVHGSFFTKDGENYAIYIDFKFDKMIDAFSKSRLVGGRMSFSKKVQLMPKKINDRIIIECTETERVVRALIHQSLGSNFGNMMDEIAYTGKYETNSPILNKVEDLINSVFLIPKREDQLKLLETNPNIFL